MVDSIFLLFSVSFVFSVLALWVSSVVMSREFLLLSGELVLAEEGGDFGDEIVNASDDADDDGVDGAPDAGEYRSD